VKLWSQIPFAGTLIIPLSPSKADNFLMEHSFDRNDIDKLIDFSKDTGRVQFVLNSSPRLYENSDHLESVFSELEPPVLSIPWQLFGGYRDFDVWKQEFQDLITPAYITDLAHRVEEVNETSDYMQSMISYHSGVYSRLKLLKMEDEIDEVKNYINHAPDYTISYLDYLGFVLEDLFNPMQASTNHNFEELKFYSLQLKHPSLTECMFPVDIGRFIIRKITLNPQSYYGCIEVIQRYEKTDLYSLLESLDKGIREKDKGIREKDKEAVKLDLNGLGTVLEDIWNDSYGIRQGVQISSWGII
jgi:hypothetical protein